MRHTRGWIGKPPNLLLAALVFAAELVVWFGLGFATYTIMTHAGAEPLWAVVGGAGATVGLVALWGTFLAPRAKAQLPLALRIAVIVLLYGAVGAVFIAADLLWVGIAIIVVGSAIQIAGQIVMREWADQRRQIHSGRYESMDPDEVT